jgi:hypothetical protein
MFDHAPDGSHAQVGKMCTLLQGIFVLNGYLYICGYLDMYGYLASV